MAARERTGVYLCVVLVSRLPLMWADYERLSDLPAVATSGRSKMSGVGMRFNNVTQQLDVLQSTDVDIAPKDQREGATPPAQ